MKTVGAGSALTNDLKSAYIAKFGPMITGKQIPVLVKHITTATGAAGTASAVLCLVGA